VLLVGCGGGSTQSSPAPTIDFRTPPPAVSTPSPTSLPTSSPQPGTSLTVVAKNTTPDSSVLHTTAGTVTITFMNEDNGTVHNFHLFKGTDANGTSIGQTALEAGPVTKDSDCRPGTRHISLPVRRPPRPDEWHAHGKLTEQQARDPADARPRPDPWRVSSGGSFDPIRYDVSALSGPLEPPGIIRRSHD
jgi:hypothetical protein